MEQRTVKRGDTLSIVVTRTDSGGAAVDITGMTVASKIRLGTIVQTLTVTVTDAANGVVTLSATATATATWAPGTYKCDIQYTDGSDVASSETFEIVVQEDVTY